VPETLQGGGEVQLSLPTVRALPPVSLLQEGMVKRVRGVAHSMRVSPQNSNRMVRWAASTYVSSASWLACSAEVHSDLLICCALDFCQILSHRVVARDSTQRGVHGEFRETPVYVLL
jgi:RNA 3'-terminal phosphate cyclase (RTC), insert domain